MMSSQADIQKAKASADQTTENDERVYWFETTERYWTPLPTVIHPEGYRLNRRLNLYLLLAGFGGIPIALIAQKLGAPPLVIGIAFAALTLLAFAVVSVWYVKKARAHTRVV